MRTNTATPSTAAAERTSPVPGGDPRFDLSSVGALSPRLSCQSCNARIVDRHWRLDGAVTCAQCLGGLRRAEAAARRWSSLALAARRAAPVVALGGAGYALLVWVTDAWFAWVTIGIGHLIGTAVQGVAGRFATRRHQLLALALTYATVCLGNVVPAAQALRGESALAVLAVCLFMPFLNLMSGLSGAVSFLIVGLGLREAWRRSAGEPCGVTGPHLLPNAARPPHGLG